MFFKLASLCTIVIFLIVSYLNIDTHESPVLLPPKNDVKKETDQVSLQIKEPMIVKKDECESYIATPISKICLPPRIHNDDKKELEAINTISPVSVATEESSSIPKYFNDPENVPPVVIQIQDIEQAVPSKINPSKETPEVVFISPF